MMKRLGIKRGIILILLGTFLYMGMLCAGEIPAIALDGLKVIKPIVLELLATSEYSNSEELKKRIVATSEAFKKYANEYGAAIGLGDDSSSSNSSALPTVKPMPPIPTTTPAIVISQPQKSVLPAPVLGAPAPDESAGTEDIKPEPPAAALGVLVAPSGEAIQSPAVLAAPVVVPVVPAPGGVAAPTSAVPGIADIQSMGDLTVPADGSSAQSMIGLPGATGLMPLGDLTPLQPLETPPIAAPAQVMPGAVAPQPLQPAFGAMPTLNPMTPAPSGASQATMMPVLPALPPLSYHELDSVDSLDGEMDQLMAMNIPGLPVLSNIQPLATVSEYDQEIFNMELMSLAMQEAPSIVMDEALDDLNLNDLTLAGLE